MRRFRHYLLAAMLCLLIACAPGGCEKKEQQTHLGESLSDQLAFYGNLSFPNALASLDLDNDNKMNSNDLETLKLWANANSGKGDINRDGTTDEMDVDLLSLLLGNGSDMPIGLLDFNRDGQVDEDDYRLPATSPKTFQPFYSEKEAKALMAGGAKGYLYPVPATNLIYADLQSAYVWDMRINIPKLKAEKRTDGSWLLKDGAAGDKTSLHISTPDSVISLTIFGDSFPEWQEGDKLVWGGFLWKFNGNLFQIEGVAAQSTDVASNSNIIFANLLNLIVSTASAEESILPEIIDQFNDFESQVWNNNRKLSNLFKKLTGDLGKKPECKTINCQELKLVMADMDSLVDAGSGSHTLSVIAKENAKRIWEIQSGTISAIKKGTKDVQRVLFWQKSALLAGDIAADLIDSLLTGNPTAVIDDMINYGVGAGTDMVFNQSKFVSSLSDSMGGMGVVSVENGKISFDPSSGSLDKVKNLNSMLTAKNAADVRKAKLALTSMILKSIIKATTSSAISETEKDLKNVLAALARAKAFDRDMGMAVMIYTGAEKRMRKIKGRLQGQRQDLFSLMHDCAYKEKEKSCTATLQTDLEKAKAVREKIEGDAVKQEKEKAAEIRSLEAEYEAALENTKIFQKKKHEISEKIIEAIRATTLSNKDEISKIRKGYEAELKQIDAKQQAEWNKLKDIKEQLKGKREALRKLSAKNMKRKWKATDAYRRSVSDANSAFQKCLGPKIANRAPLRKAVKIKKNDKGLIPPWMIYEPLIKAQNNMLSKAGDVKLWKDDPDCGKETAAPSTAPLNEISGCYHEVSLFAHDARMVLDVKGDSAKATFEYIRTVTGWDNANDRELPPVNTKHKMEFSGSYKAPWVELTHYYSRDSIINVMDFSEWAIESFGDDGFASMIGEKGRMVQKLRSADDRGVWEGVNYDASYIEIIGSKKRYVPLSKLAREKLDMDEGDNAFNNIRYTRETPDITEMVVTKSDYKTEVRSVKNGEKVWIVAKSKKSCGVGRSRVMVVAKPASTTMACLPLSKNYLLYETAPGSNEYRSDPSGITIKCRPDNLPGGLELFETVLNGNSFDGERNWKLNNVQTKQVRSKPFAIITDSGTVNK